MLAIAQLQYRLCRDVPLYQDPLYIGMSNACDCPAAVSSVPRRTSVSGLLVHRHVESFGLPSCSIVCALFKFGMISQSRMLERFQYSFAYYEIARSFDILTQCCLLDDHIFLSGKLIEGTVARVLLFYLIV